MKIFKPIRYQWVGPLIALFLGVSSIYNPKPSMHFIVAWIILVAFAIVLLIIGIVNHYQFIKEKLMERI